jgi:hypothetical protein
MTLANFLKSKNLEEYNCPFSLDELRKSLDKAHDTACGPDDIHYQLLKHLPESALQVLLDLMNDIWETGDLPSIWKLANVIPIPKPDKDHSEPSNYRPIGSLPFNPISKRPFNMPYFHVVSYAFSKSKKIYTARSFLAKAFRIKVSNR